MKSFSVISPVNGEVYVERPYASNEQIANALEKANGITSTWRNTSIVERAELVNRAVDQLIARKDIISNELTWQMGRPISFGPGEIAGFEERARHMASIAEQALQPVTPESKPGFERFIRREPLGQVFVIAPWNFPFLTAVNAVVPALLSGNTVLIKHSAQTPLCAERFVEAFTQAGLPEGVFQYLHLDHTATEQLIKAPETAFVAFTGSVPGGEMVERAVAGLFKGVGLELGGKDPAYVRNDADLKQAIDTVVDGAFFNSGQSCCGIERVYVHQSIFDDFVGGAIELVNQYKLGPPQEPQTNLGPMVRSQAADFVRGQIDEAITQGAVAHIDADKFAYNRNGTAYLAPQLLTNVNHDMRVMTEESFGPVVGIQAVKNDAEAIALMNDSDFGLTAAVFTQDQDAALSIGSEVNTGTWFMNRCDYLDPALAWTGVKNSGRGCTLSSVGFEQLTRPKSFHLKLPQ
ncbi:MAG: acyl-CoA reductase-like NAD-dependent aldehyde dehydrogenase [Parasphingorhabdus sp.]|jgi:acyl-CoA reductase-like NAD-dependent aldehyde dehydrogenase